ncbi:MAG TPA: acyl carrier protein [Candidatus Limnocylindrales bacterium]|nr:acyl carrier protein [Candidatus Limnocylindrales bacterium]
MDREQPKIVNRQPTNVTQALENYILSLPALQGKGITTLQSTDSFIDQGIFDSLSLLDFVVFIEKLCKIKIPGEDIMPENFGSLEAVMKYLGEKFGIQ